MRVPYLHSFFEFISHNNLFGIPLDIPAHLIVGAIASYYILRKTQSIKTCLISILLIALMKELYDQKVMTNTLLENIKDITITMLPAFLLVYFHQLKTSRALK
jgi:hypothetical protein